MRVVTPVKKGQRVASLADCAARRRGAWRQGSKINTASDTVELPAVDLPSPTFVTSYGKPRPRITIYGSAFEAASTSHTDSPVEPSTPTQPDGTSVGAVEALQSAEPVIQAVAPCAKSNGRSTATGA
jgi:hypothetical protein